MRKSRKIIRILKLIEKIWLSHPRLRLYQLIGECFPVGQDLYILTDKELEDKLKEFYQPEVEE